MHVSFGKILSLVIACAVVLVLALRAAGADHVLLAALCLLLPLALIWFPERLGASWPRKKTRLGYDTDAPSSLRHPARRDSHPAMVTFMGWLFLLGLPALFAWLSAR